MEPHSGKRTVEYLSDFIGFISLISGLLALLISPLLVPSEIGLCADSNSCESIFRSAEKYITFFLACFVTGLVIFGSIRFRGRLRIITLLYLPFLILFYLLVPNGGGWGVPSGVEMVGWPLTVIFGVIIFISVLKRLLPNLSKFLNWYSIIALIILVFFIFIAIVSWL